MTTAPETRGSDPSRRRRLIIFGVVGVALVVVLALAAAWFFFFGSEAPDAPTIDNAIKVLLPSEPPE